MRFHLILAILVVIGAAAGAADTGFLDKTYEAPGGTTYAYVLFVPHDYKKGTPTPTVLSLHGSGETKGGTKMPVEVGIGTAIKKR